MANYTRNNAWNNGGDFSNLDLLWYAKGVGRMMSRKLNDPASWWFYAAIHGEYVDPKGQYYVKPPAYPDWQFIQAPPAVPTKPLPGSKEMSTFWNQCQHATWYFPPWHRGYLMALEGQLRNDIIALKGPQSWALPYWNYFGGANQSTMPPAFSQKTLPDGTANPLFVDYRFGPDGDGNIYVPIGPVNDKCLGNDLYTGSDSVTPPPGFGGGVTGFEHFGNATGNLENNPHNLVHGYVGGSANGIGGLMGDPGQAALDPIFYLHHANIDRMWAVWNANGNSNPTDPAWLNGPSDGKFIMPNTASGGAGPWVYTPQQVSNLGNLNYTYQELASGAAPASSLLGNRLNLLGVKNALTMLKSEPAALSLTRKVELIGANEGKLRVQSPATETVVKLDSGVNRKVVQSLVKASQTALPDNVFLKLEKVRGNFDASVFAVYVNLPEKAGPDVLKAHLAGHVGLFGLRRASAKDGKHGGQGLTFVLDISHIIDTLFLAKDLGGRSLRVSFVPQRGLADETEITVGRVSIYRQSH